MINQDSFTNELLPKLDKSLFLYRTLPFRVPIEIQETGKEEILSLLDKITKKNPVVKNLIQVFQLEIENEIDFTNEK